MSTLGERMNYKLNNRAFFKKISSTEVNVLFVDDDNFIYKIDKIAAQVFLMIVDEKLSIEIVQERVMVATGKKENEVKIFLDKFYHHMTELNFFTKV
jgi:hypothetical protein